MVSILLNNAKPIQAKPLQKPTKRPRPSIKYQTLYHTKNRGFWIWLLNAWESRREESQNPGLVAPSASSSPRAPSVLEVPAGVVATARAVAHHPGHLLQRTLANCWKNALANCGIDHSKFKPSWIILNWRVGKGEEFLSDELRCHGQFMPCSMFFKLCSRPLTGTNPTAKMLLFMGWTSSSANPNMT